MKEKGEKYEGKARGKMSTCGLSVLFFSGRVFEILYLIYLIIQLGEGHATYLKPQGKLKKFTNNWSDRV